MSASEKLKALDGAATSGPWYQGRVAGSPDPEAQSVVAADGNICGMWDGGQTFDSIMANARFIASLRSALPQIVAVVEAAEMLYDGDGPWDGDSDACHAIAVSLTALEEALRDVT